MNSTTRFVSRLLGAGAIVVILVAASWTAAEPRPLSKNVFMRVKLASSQKLLEGLVTRDFDLIRVAASEMKEMSEAAEWPRAQDSVYTHYSEDFRRHCDKLVELAKNENFEGASFSYFQVTSACITCHDHVRRNLHPAEDPANPFQLIPNWDKDQPIDRLDAP